MRLLLFLIFFSVQFSNVRAQEHKNRILLTASSPSYHKILYHTIGYARVIPLKASKSLELYGGVGYIPIKGLSNMFGQKIYAYSLRSAISHNEKIIQYSMAFEYTYIDAHTHGIRNENIFLSKFGFGYSIFKNRISFMHFLNFGRIHSFDPNNHDSRKTHLGIGLDIGFNF